jgi:two-component system, NarL family, nitrate/nitrite response regulator NarL
MAEPERTRTLVVDDHTLFRRGLISLLSRTDWIDVVGDAGDASEAQRKAEALSPDLILLDNHLPGVHGVDAIPSLRKAVPTAKIVMLTVSEDESDLARALQAGANGYLLKTMESDALIAAIERVMKGNSVLADELTNKLVSAFRGTASPPPAVTDDPVALLSPREREILRAIAQGQSNKHIARELGIAETTVKIHVQHVLRKLDVTSRVQAAVIATERGVV